MLSAFCHPHPITTPPALWPVLDTVGRDPLRKLGKEDRLIKPLLNTIRFGLPTRAGSEAKVERWEQEDGGVPLQSADSADACPQNVVIFLGLKFAQPGWATK